MKLSALFAKYLYQNKKLNLPGIGTFSIDPSVTIPDASDKTFSDFTQQIQFTQKNITAADDDFINFIRTETGKIRPLAESDLDSFLSDGKILMNIGKPFHFEGIGSLIKNKAGQYEFIPGESMLGRADISPHHHESPNEPAKRSVFNEDIHAPNNSRKILIALAIIVGIVLVIWLGYRLYNRNTSAAVAEDTVAIAPSDTSRANIILDSVQKIIDSSISKTAQPNGPQPGTYKFVIERTSNKARALRRFNQIKENLTDIKMEPNADSSLFSLYFILPATPSDTTRIKDSLRIWYGRKQVFIGQ